MNFSKSKGDLIFLRSERARVKINDLAGMLKKSSQLLKYSLDTMEDGGIIHNPHCIFDYSYFGLVLFRVYFKGAYISEKDKSDIVKALSEDDYVVSIYGISGEFDLVVEIQAPNPSRFNKVIKAISNSSPTLTHYKTVLNVVTYIYPKSYLLEKDLFHSHVPSQVIIGGDRSVEVFSENELSVMKSLLNNPTARMMTLAKQSSLNIKTFKDVFENLQDRNIVKGFKYLIDTNKLDISRFRLFLNLHNLSNEREAELMDYLKKSKEIVQANKTVGDWDMEIDIESLDKARARQLVIEMRELFKDIIETFNIMEVYQHYNRAYLPKYYFSHSENLDLNL